MAEFGLLIIKAQKSKLSGSQDCEEKDSKGSDGRESEFSFQGQADLWVLTLWSVNNGHSLMIFGYWRKLNGYGNLIKT